MVRVSLQWQSCDMALAEFELIINGPGRDEATPGLKVALYDGGADRVEEINVSRPDPGTRPADVVSVAALAVSIVSSAAQVVGVAREWLANRRGKGVDSITLVIGDDSIEIIEPSTGSEENRIEEFIRRHDEDS